MSEIVTNDIWQIKELVPAVLDILGLSVILNVEVWEYFIF